MDCRLCKYKKETNVKQLNKDTYKMVKKRKRGNLLLIVKLKVKCGNIKKHNLTDEKFIFEFTANLVIGCRKTIF